MRRRLVTAIVIALGVLALVGYAVGAPFFGPETARVTVVDEDGETLGTVDARVADSTEERYRGLSGTESLANGSGMLFVYGEEAERTFVMREMNYPIDMVFVGEDGRITAIHHAELPDSETLERYQAPGKWVLEVPHNWTTRRGISVGDRVRIDDD